MIDIKKLRYFVAVAEEQHFSRAAERLGISQPPLSEHIRALEQELGCALFCRTTRSVSLTDDGISLLPHARRILADLDQCAEVIRDARLRNMNTLRLGILHAHAYTFLPRLLAQWANTRKDVRIKLIEHATQNQIAVLTTENVDLAFVREPVHDQNVVVTRLFSEPYWIAIPEGWTTHAGDQISVTELHNQPMIGFPSHHASGSTRALFRDLFIKHRIKTSDFLQITTMHAALALVAAGQGFCPVPKSQRRLSMYGVKYLPLMQTSPQLSVGIASKQHAMDPFVQSFVDFCVLYFKQDDW